MPSRFFVGRPRPAGSGETMRVIAGEAHGRRLRAPRGTATRPTSARVRESIFSRLGARLDFGGLKVLDLFAGSGALGIEALSRGAGHATFVDSSRAAGAAIRTNLESLGLAKRGRVMVMQAHRALGELARRGERFDLVLMDAPYRMGAGGDMLTLLVELDLLTERAWLAVEMSRRATPARPAGLELESIATLGDHRIALYRRADGSPS